MNASWYHDPTGRYDQRYWDGARWTEHVSRAGAQMTDVEPVAAPGPLAPVGVYGGGYGYAAFVQQRTNGLAIASMVLGILWLYWIGSILALIFGFVAKSQIRQSNGTQSGGGMATAGIVLGFIGVGTLALVIVIGIVAATSDDSYYYGLAPLLR